MQKGSKSAVFYKLAGVETEIRSGYLFKSPPAKLMKTEKSWKKRFFVLFKINADQHELKYFRNAEDRDKALGGINLQHVAVMHVNPQHHPKWGLIQKSFKCSPSCVLYIETLERDYFLIGDNSDEVDAWYSDLFEALRNRPHVLHNTDELIDGQQTIEVITKPDSKRRNSASLPLQPQSKMRSVSDPCNALDSANKPKSEDAYKRRASEPVNPIYDYPRSFLTQIQVTKQSDSNIDKKAEAIYESMSEMTQKPQKENTGAPENQDFTNGTLMRSVTQVFEKMKIHVSQMPTCNEESDTENRQKVDASDSSSSSSENSTLSNENLSSIDSPEPVAPEERDIKVKLADLKKHLLLTETDGILSVSGWIDYPNAVSLFHRGDQILGVNHLRATTMEEFDMYINKSLRTTIKVTIRRLPEPPTPRSPASPCSD